MCGCVVPGVLLFHPLDLFFASLSSQLFNMLSDNLWKWLSLPFTMQHVCSDASAGNPEEFLFVLFPDAGGGSGEHIILVHSAASAD